MCHKNAVFFQKKVSRKNDVFSENTCVLNSYTDVMYSLLLNCTPEQINFIGSKAVTFFGANESEQHDIEAEWKASLIEVLGLCSIEQLQAIANNADQYFIDNFETEADPDTQGFCTKFRIF